MYILYLSMLWIYFDNNSNTNNKIGKMFNNQLEQTNLLSCTYSSGNVVFVEDTVYSPVLNYIKEMDLKNNKTSILPFQAHNNIKILKVHPSKIIMIVIDVVGYAIVYNLKARFVIAEYNFKGVVSSAEFSEDGGLFVITQAHGFLVYKCPSIWKTFQPFTLLKKYKNRHSDNITSCTISPDSRFLITCGLDNIIHINNLFPIKDYIAFSLQVHRYKILGASYSKDMQYIYSIDSGSNLYVWKWVQDHLSQGFINYRDSRRRIRDNARSAGRKVVKKEENTQENQQQLEQAENQEVENQLYSDFQKRVNKGRYILAHKLIVTQPGAYLKRYYYDNNTGFLATAYSNGKFSIYKLIQEELNQIQTFTVGTYKISSICVNQSCTWIALAIKSAGQIIIWQWKSQSYILSQKGLVYDTISLASYKNSKYIATGNTQGQVKLWQKSSGLSLVTFSEHDANVSDLKFSNPTTLFSCSLDGNVHAYDAVKYRKFRTYKPDKKCQLNCLSLDETGQIVLAGAFDPYEIYAWNVQTANILQIIRGHEGPVSCIELSGDYLISGSWDKTLKIHQLYARKLNVETLQHSSQITALAIHPDGRQYAAATIRGQIYIWQMEDNQLVGIIDAEVKGGRSYFSKISAENDTNTKYLKTLVYSQCGKYLIGGGKSKYVYFYDVQHRMIIDKIQLTRNRDLQGVVEKLNSKFVKQGHSTYQMMLEEQEKDMSDDQANIKLPGSKKIDVSQIRTKLEVDVKKIIILDSQSYAICTSFGVLIYSSNLRSRHIFNPYEFDPTLTPQKIITMLQEKQYTSALVGALCLNLPIQNLLKKIPLQQIKQVVSEIEVSKLNILLQKLSEKQIDFRECLWVDSILKISDVKIPSNLLLSLENLGQQTSLLQKIQARLDIVNLMQL